MKEIIARFGINGSEANVRPLGNGLINSTLLVELPGDGKKYVLQKINNSIFTDVDALQHNIKLVTECIDKHLKDSGISDTSRRCLHFLPDVVTGKTYYCTPGGEYYRMMEFIPDSITHESMNADLARAAGKAFGDFQKIVAPLASELKDTIPHFHDMEFRLAQLDEAVAADKVGRVANCRELLDYISSLRDEATLPEKMYREGKLPLRVCHCDTKVNNVLFDNDGNILCVIDLDTVMPSLILSDYGDFLRTGANAAPEDEPDLSRIALDHEIYDAFTEGYLETATFLTEAERELLPKAMFRFAFMQGVRFLTDYLQGDTYFKIQYPEHNLVRTRAQLHLASLALPAE